MSKLKSAGVPIRITIVLISLITLNWVSFYATDNVDERWSIILNHITSYLDEVCPIKDMSFKDRNKPWITRDILESIYERNEYMAEYCRG